jgi:hypothetical protein
MDRSLTMESMLNGWPCFWNQIWLDLLLRMWKSKLNEKYSARALFLKLYAVYYIFISFGLVDYLHKCVLKELLLQRIEL